MKHAVSSVLIVLVFAAVAQAQLPDARDLAFFETKIRPVLVEYCYECHSAGAKKLRGKLLLDSRAGWQEGGESGAVIAPGHPEDSVLLSALRYEKFQMPPRGKLPPEVIDDFADWIKMGAPDPREGEPHVGRPEAGFDLEARKDWWSLQPVAHVEVPTVRQQDWPQSRSDHFILAALEEKGWAPATPATRSSWLRRVSYDLTGLPPTPDELRDFLNDDTPDAFATVVDRLLDSPHFGEQWARHWMDLVRFAETKAFEADYAMPNVYQYRDYLIRAFNSDVPYNQFVKEAIAGDLIPPRLNPKTGINESVIGPGYLYLTDGQHGPPDIHLDQARIFDDMIDVLGKTFLSHTLACARCHDHKFDALTTRDYYSLYGIIASSRIDYADINPPQEQQQHRERLRAKKQEVVRAVADVLREDLKATHDDLATVARGKPSSPQQQRWAQALEKSANDTLRQLASLLNAKTEATRSVAWKRTAAQMAAANTPSLGNLSRSAFGDWLASGVAFGGAPRPAGDFVITPEGDKVIASFVGGHAAAGHLGSRFSGSIKSPTFTLQGDAVRVRVKGRNVRVSLYVRHYELIGRGPTTGGTTKVINSDTWQTVTFGTRLWIGEPAYIELQHNGGEMVFNWSTKKHTDGSYGALHSAANNADLPPLKSESGWQFGGAAPTSQPMLIEQLALQIEAAVAGLANNTLTLEQSDLLGGLLEAGVLDVSLQRSEALQTSVEAYRQLQRAVPAPRYVRSLSDGHGIDEPVYIRGSHKNVSTAPNPRHFLEAIDPAPIRASGSGRLQWAQAVASADNPLTARVMVNRIWHHLFGRGVVSSVDDFGHMGEKPSHPELLDYLALQFVEDNWSVKRLIRRLVLSSTYRMSSTASAVSQRHDPHNVWLQHMPLRRLQAEQIRDTLLAVSGQLDPQLFGPSQGGDGGNRRSVYIQLRRRFMPEFLMTFDMPNATEPFGRRNSTAGPTQSLAMLNGPLVWRAAEHWARRIHRAEVGSFADRVDLLHQQAFGRSASPRELAWAQAVLADQGVDPAAATQSHWKELCHTMLNRKELLFVY